MRLRPHACGSRRIAADLGEAYGRPSRTSQHVLEYPGGYTRSVGPGDRAFPHGAARRPHRGRAAGRRSRARAADGVRPGDERAGRGRRRRTGSRSGRAAPCSRARGSRSPRAGKHPLDQAVRVRADPPRRCRHRVAARGRLRQRRRDPRSARGSRPAGGPSAPGTSPTSRRGSRSATARSPSRPPLHVPAEDEQPVTGITVADPARVRAHRGRGDRPLPRGSGRGQDHRRPGAVERRRVRGVARHRPEDRRADVDRGRGAGHAA